MIRTSSDTPTRRAFPAQRLVPLTTKTPMFSLLDSRAVRILVCAAAATLWACGGSDSSSSFVAAPEAARFGKTTTSVSVASVSPDSGTLSTTLDVKVNGSGFVDGMVAVWERAGVSDSTQIKTNSTRWISSKQLVANITITSTASSGTWDVSVYSGGKTGIGSELGVLKDGFKVTDPTATWYFPLNDAGLSIQSDRSYSDGTSSVYANGVCSVTTTIFASTENSSSGDATLGTGNPKSKCVRRFQIVYPDGYTESPPIFSNLRGIENTKYSIPIGATVLRQLHFGTTWPNVASRCIGLVWGYGVANDIAAGSDSVLVTRVDASTWHVASQPPPNNRAWCKATGELFPMSVEFTVVSSRPLQ